MNTVETPRVAVVGMGAFGTVHAETVRKLDGVRLAALVETDRSRHATLSQTFPGIPVYSSLEELIAAKAADAVIIATRASTHTALATTAMKAGLAILVEKPAAETEAEIEAMIAVRNQTGAAAMVNHICLFHSLIHPLLKKVEEKGFRAAHFVRHRSALQAQRFPEAHPLRLMMVHDLYVAAQMVRGEEPVEFHFIDSGKPGHTPDMSWATLRWADGRVATFHAHSTLPPGSPAEGWDRTEVFGVDYHSVVQTNPAPWQWHESLAEWPVSLEISTVHGRPVGMLAEALRSFAAAVRGAPVPCGCRLEDALQIERWADKLIHSRKA